MQSPSHEIICHLPWRLPRQSGLHVLYLPDGNNRSAQNLEGYAGGANRFVDIAHYTASRGDVAVVAFCIVSDLNVEKRPEEFVQKLVEQFGRLLTNINHKGILIRAGIRCRVFGNIEKLRSMGGVHQRLIEEIEAVCEATNGVVPQKMEVQFWVGYSSDIAYESDTDAVIRTGAEDARVARPGLSLPPNVQCVVTTTLWPEVQMAEMETMLDGALREATAHFGRGYDLEFAEHLLRFLPSSRVPARARLSLPVCAPEAEIMAMLKRLYANPHDAPMAHVQYMSREGMASFGPTEDVWYTLRLIPAARWVEFAPERYDAIITPGQHAGTVRLAMPAGQAHVHSCVATVDGVLDAFSRAIQFPIKHVLLHGADRRESAALKMKTPWSADLVELMPAFARHPQWSVEHVVRAFAPPGIDALTETAWRIQALTAKIFGQALADGMILPDEPRQHLVGTAARAITMLRPNEETFGAQTSWENAGEIVMRSILALAAGEEGIFDRVYPGETQQERRKRIEASVGYLDLANESTSDSAPTATRNMRLVQAIRKHWQELTNDRAATSQAALRRHYAAKEREQAPEVLDNPLASWLGLGGLPRREAMQKIEQDYAGTTPEPIAERLRALLATEVTDDRQFQAVLRETRVLLYLADTAHRRGMEVLAEACVLTLPQAEITTERRQTAELVARLADYVLQMNADVAAFGREGTPEGLEKPSALTILLPKTASMSEYMTQLRLARETGRNVQTWLEQEFRRALQTLETSWPAMAVMIERLQQFRQTSLPEEMGTAPSIAEIRALVQQSDDADLVAAPHSELRPVLAPMMRRDVAIRARLPQP